MGMTDRIISAEIYRVSNPSLRPTVIRLHTESGTVGLGDAGASFGVGTESIPSLLAELLRTFVLGRPLSDRRAILMDLNSHTFWGKRAGSLFGGAVSAIDQALHDATARTLGAPLHDLLGGRIHDQLPVYANGWYFGQHTEDDRLTAAAAVVADGHKALKTYPLVTQGKDQRLQHPSPAQWDRSIVPSAIDHVRSLRARIGDEIGLMVDLSGCLQRDRAHDLLNAMQQLQVEFVEEPFDPDDESSTSWLGAQTPLPVATGERLVGIGAFERTLRTGGCSILQPDVCLVGGHGVFHAVAALAATHSVRISPHNCSSGIGTAHTIHAAATIPNLHSIETFPYLATIPGYQEILTKPLEHLIVAGSIPVPDGPGIGVDLDDDIIGESLVDMLEPT